MRGSRSIHISLICGLCSLLCALCSPPFASGEQVFIRPVFHARASGGPAVDPALRLWYAFASDTAPIWTDSTANGNTGTNSDTIAWTNAASGAISFTGAGSIQRADNASVSPTGSITVAVWFKTGTSGRMSLVNKRNVSDSFLFGVSTITAGKISLLVWDSVGTLWYRTSSAATLTDAGWHHAVGVFDSGVTVNTYVDGVVDNGTLTGSSISNLKDGGDALEVGAEGTTGYRFTGQMGDVKLYARPLSSNEVNTLFLAEKATYGL